MRRDEKLAKRRGFYASATGAPTFLSWGVFRDDSRLQMAALLGHPRWMCKKTMRLLSFGSEPARAVRQQARAAVGGLRDVAAVVANRERHGQGEPPGISGRHRR